MYLFTYPAIVTPDPVVAKARIVEAVDPEAEIVNPGESKYSPTEPVTVVSNLSEAVVFPNSTVTFWVPVPV